MTYINKETFFDDEFDITKYFKNIESNRREVVATPALASL